MPKIRNTDIKGLVQEPGSGVTFEQGALKRELVILSATVDTAGTGTDLGITPEAGDRCLGYKIEILSTTGGPANNLTDLGYKAGDDDAISGPVASIAMPQNTVATRARPANAVTRDADMTATELHLKHGNPGGGKSARVRVTVLLERYS